MALLVYCIVVGGQWDGEGEQGADALENRRGRRERIGTDGKHEFFF